MQFASCRSESRATFATRGSKKRKKIEKTKKRKKTHDHFRVVGFFQNLVCCVLTRTQGPLHS
ncbi:hypothetical protein Q31b_21560 [Novipirellula aureliae]|uniref:Uncharacterized protein n=1 Tax=Novipirellula aureliae TaxID=2527966 RepID=A0A5C6E7D2_9BACT|nr:hypothetical protein Q31b_21560 [Novipirellula aureliae]